MKLCQWRIKQNASVRGRGFWGSFLELLGGVLSIGAGLLMISCATTPPQQTYLTSTSLTGISKVAIFTSANAPEVTYSINAPGSGTFSLGAMLLGPLLIFPAMGIEAAVRTSVDKEHAQNIGGQADLSIIEARVAEAFINSLAKGGYFEIAKYMTNKNQDERQLVNAGYNAVIKLALSKISLERVVGDNVGLHVHMNGQMKSLKSGKIIWDREEVVISSEAGAHPLDYYKDKENLLKELESILGKAGQNLAYDFVYLK